MDRDYYYTNSSSQAQAYTPEAIAALLGVLAFLFFIVVIAYVVGAFLLGRIFKKAGVPQWAAWVPIYNGWKTLELGNQQGFWAALALIPFVGIISGIFTFIAMYHIGKKLGKEDWFVLLAIFVPIVWLIWLAFDDSTWPKTAKTTSPKPVEATAQ